MGKLERGVLANVAKVNQAWVFIAGWVQQASKSEGQLWGPREPSEGKNRPYRSLVSVFHGECQRS